MAAHFRSFSIYKPNPSWSAFRWLLLAMSLVFTLSGCGGLTIRESYEQGVKKAAAGDHKGALKDFDEAIANQSRLPEFLLKTHKINMERGTPSDLIFLSDAYLQRSTCKALLDDIPGAKADYVLYEKQVELDGVLKKEIAADIAAKMAEDKKDAADAKASAEDKRKAEACVKEGLGTYKNICDRPVKVYFKNAILTTKCKTNLLGVLGTKLSPGETVRIPLECASDIRYDGASLY
jgi:hypothetical protein